MNRTSRHWRRPLPTPITSVQTMPDVPVLFAYIDPGTGSYVLQMALAGLLGAGYTIRRFWTRITALFGRSSAPHADDAQR